jgi:type III secretion system YscJ/HrcJ family lipoprotein
MLSACGADVVVHGINEREANQIIETLADHEITAQKLINLTGREIVYDVAVGGSARLDAIRVLNKFELPRRRDKGYHETFSESGLIPTSAEERAKRLAALEGEIERQVKLIDGVLDVQVQIVMPEESALRTTQQQEPMTTASVTIKYLPGAGGSRPVSEPEVQAIVAAGVEKLSPENVVVLMRPAGGIQTPAKEAAAAAKDGKSLEGVPRRFALIGAAGALVLIALLGLGLMFAQISLRRVRTRLIRLQTEIAKARQKKPGESLPAVSSSPGTGSLTSP